MTLVGDTDRLARGERVLQRRFLPPAERRAIGRGARRTRRRGQLGKWDPQARTYDFVEMLAAQNDRRLRYLVPLRHGRMAASPWTYYRGAAAVMAADLRRAELRDRACSSAATRTS